MSLAARVLELVGLGLALVGFYKSWVQYGTGYTFIGYLTEPVPGQWRRALRHLPESWRKRLGARPRTRQAAATVTVRTGGYGHLGVRYPALPALQEDPEAFRLEVTRRISDLREELNALQSEQAQESRTRAREIGELTTAVKALEDHVRASARDLAVGGLRLQVVGWLCVLVSLSLDVVADWPI